MTALAPLPTRRPARALDVEIVVPVFNEEAALERSVRRLHRFLCDEFPFSWRVVVADNASTDATPNIARHLAAALPGVSVLRLDRKGRGRALRAAWSASPARVVAYMDVDLSTDLRGLLPLVAPLLSGHSDPRDRLAARQRRPRRARTQARADLPLLQPHPARRAARPVQRRAVRLQGRPDRRAGLRAARRGARRRMVLRHGAAGPRAAARAAHPRGAGRLGRRSRLARAHRPHRARRPARRRPARRRRAADRFLGIGAVSTALFALLFLLLRGPLGAASANTVALAVTAVLNTAANRRLTFRLRGREHLVRHHIRGAAVFVLTVALSTGALASCTGSTRRRRARSS